MQRYLYLDLRALAAFRVIFGGILIIDLIERLLNIEFYTDPGMLPFDLYELNIPSFSWHYLSGEAAFQYGLLGFILGLAGCFFLGWKTKWITPLLFLMWVSLSHRNLYYTHGADRLVVIFLLFASFLPLNRCWSIEQRQASPIQISSWASVGFIFQLAMIYVQSGMIKALTPAWQEGHGIYYSLSRYQYSTTLGEWVASLSFLPMLNGVVLFLEVLIPLGLLLPIHSEKFRFVIPVIFIGFHLLLGELLHLWLFPWVAIAAWIAILPSSFWNKLCKTSSASLQKISSFRSLGQSIILLLFVYLMSLNIWFISIWVKEDIGLQTPEWFLNIPEFFFINERFGFYATPESHSTWHLVTGTFSNGEQYDLLDPTRDSLSRPLKNSPIYQIRMRRWDFLYREEDSWKTEMNDSLRQNYAARLCQEFLQQEPFLESIKIVEVRQPILLESQRGAIQSDILLEFPCQG